MKKLMFALVVSTVCAAGAVAAEGLKIGTVDLLVLVRNHPSYETNHSMLKDKDKDYKKQLDAIKAEGEELQAEGKKLIEQLGSPMMNEKAKADLEKKVRDIQGKLVTIEQRYRTEAMRSQQDWQDLETRLSKATMEDLRKRIDKFAEAGGYDLILDANSTPFAKKSFDVTDEMLKAMGVDPKDAKRRDSDEGK